MRPNQHGRIVPSHNICCAVLVKREERKYGKGKGRKRGIDIVIAKNLKKINKYRTKNQTHRSTGGGLTQINNHQNKLKKDQIQRKQQSGIECLPEGCGRLKGSLDGEDYFGGCDDQLHLR